ncbi:hypothetical protein [Egicoccus sp. AB-alg2]
MHPATSRNEPPGWREALLGMGLVVAATAVIALAGLVLAGAASLLL